MTPVQIFLSIVVSMIGVWLQSLLPFMDQWIVIYLTVFVVSWMGGMGPGMLSAVLTLSLGGVFLIPREEFRWFHVVQLLVLCSLGFWIAFSMDRYKRSRVKLTSSEELEKARGFLDTLLENIPMMVFVKEATELRFVRFNKAGQDLLGHSSDSLIGKNDYDFFPTKEAEDFIQKDREVLNSVGIVDIPFELITTAHNGQRILHTRKIPILDAAGKPLYLLGVSEDITEKMEMEEQRLRRLSDDVAKLERAKILERESFVANAISSLSMTLDYQEALTRLVKIIVPSIGDWCTLTIKTDEGTFERVASAHRDPALQPLLDEFNRSYPPSEKDIELLSCLTEGRSSLVENLSEDLLRLRSQDQRKFELYRDLGSTSSMIIPIRSRDRILGALSIARSDHHSLDALDLATSEEIGRRAGIVLENTLLFQSTQKAVRARDEFLSIASHELKTPITSLKMQLQMLQRSNVNDKIARPLENSVKQVDRLTLLVNDLLDVSKFESGRMSYNFQDFTLGELLEKFLKVRKRALLPKSP